MMLLSLVMLVSAAGPHAPADAEASLWVPRLDQAGAVVPFFQSAGQYSLMLRADSWRPALHPLLETDFTSADSMAVAGIDSAGPLTVSRKGELTVSCVALKDSKKYQQAADARLARWGDVSHKTLGGVPTSLSTDALGRVQAGYALKGNEVCAFTALGLSLEKQLPALVAVVTKPPGAAGFKVAPTLKGAAYMMHSEAAGTLAAGLTGDAKTLFIDAEARGLDGAGLTTSGTSPYATVKTDGPAFVRARLSPQGVSNALNTLVANTPGAHAFREAANEVAPLLTGNVFAAVTGVKIKTGLRTFEMRYFASQFTFVAEVKDVEAARAAIAKIDLSALKFKEGAIEIGLRDRHLYFSNSVTSRDAVLPLIAAAAEGKQGHAVEFTVDTRASARGLAQVPLLEAMQSPEAAVLLGIGAEVGPLLNASQSISGFIDAAGPKRQKAQLTWVLAPPRETR